MKRILAILLAIAISFILAACGDSGGTSSTCTENCGSGDSSSSSGDGGGDGDGGDELGKYAVMPSNANSSAMQEKYDSWINTYYITFEDDAEKGTFNPNHVGDDVKGTARIKCKYGSCSNSGECTASEGIGYGMLLTALMDDWGRFDKLLAYSKAFRINGTALMQWDISSFYSGSGGSATDADIDILASLLIAYKKTGEQKYLNDALDIGNSIYETEIDASTHLILPAMNNENMGKGQLYNISYFSLPAIKMLVNYDKNHNWSQVLEANLAYMKKHQDGGAGLWSDWSDANALPVDPGNGSNTTITYTDGSKGDSYYAYYKETPRIPWRIAWYYHWFGDAKAKNMLNVGMDFLKSKDISSSNDIKDAYRYEDGMASQTGAGAVRWTSLCALGMGDNENSEWLNSCNQRILNAGANYAISTYYASSLQLIYAMLFNGKFDL